MQTSFIILIAVIVVAVITIVLVLSKKSSNPQSEQGLNLILQQINELSRTVDQKISENHKQVNETMRYHSTESSKLIRDITEELTRVSEGQKQVVSFADQLQSLQDIL